MSTKTGVLELSRDSGSSQAWAAAEGAPWAVLCEQMTSVLIRRVEHRLMGEGSPSSSPTTNVE